MRKIFAFLLMSCWLPTFAFAGSNAGAVATLDFVASGISNGIDDQVTTGTVKGRGTTFLVEVFAHDVRVGIVGAEIEFEIDTSIIKLDTVHGGVAGSRIFPLVLPTTETKATLGAFASGVPPNGHMATVKFIAQTDVTGLEFDINIRNMKIAVSNSDFDEFRTGRLTLNSSYIEPIPGDINRDGNVNFADFLILVQNFGSTGPVPSTIGRNISGPSRTDTVYVFSGKDTIFVPDSQRPSFKPWDKIVEEVRPSVYWLGVTTWNTNDDIIFMGTGFAVDNDALVTNFHVSGAVDNLAKKFGAGDRVAYVAISVYTHE